MPRKHLGFAVVRGRSMEPTLHEGDWLLVAFGARPRIGRLAVVRLPDGERGPRPLSVKRVTGRDPKTRQGWWVERDNPREGVDSWHVGALGDDDIEGLVLKRVPTPLLRLPRFTRPAQP
ncbi:MULTISPECIES: S26 family signal peptidase [Arsenicicoccus]|uniref:S26 family signal peptidase n=1 Tax=Arsenicicoccus bolidensis TaxID=229480 RepID=A0ABS9Q3S0_9MICO|nr:MULTISPECIES: S26 family signal peptidase [Arsenicicoccus]MCG7321905.1 S26 family signal peptidase [Arsenicicoccus bolidensis]